MTDLWTQQIEVIQPSAKPEWLTPEIEQAISNRGFPLNKDGMLMLWQRAKAKLDFYKEIEMQYRKICAVFLVPAKTEGTTNVELGQGYSAGVKHNYNYKLSANNIVEEALDEIAKIGNEGSLIAERLVSWTPNFLKTEYNILQEEATKGNQTAQAILKIVNTKMLTITEAAPNLEIKEPKAKKK